MVVRSDKFILCSCQSSCDRGSRRTGVLHSGGRERARHGRRKRVQGRGNNIQCTPHLPLLGFPLFFFRPRSPSHSACSSPFWPALLQFSPCFLPLSRKYQSPRIPQFLGLHPNMVLDTHEYLSSQGWSGHGNGLRHGAISRPIIIAQKKNSKGLGKERDDSFQFWNQCVICLIARPSILTC